MPGCHRQPQLLETSSALTSLRLFSAVSCPLSWWVAPPGEDGVTLSSKAGHHAMSDSGLLPSLIKLDLSQARWSPITLNKKTGKVAAVGSYIVT